MKLLQSRFKTALLVTSVALSFPSIGSAVSIEIAQMDAGHTFINFDTLAAGTVVNNQYAGLGVTISGTLGNNGTGAVAPVTAEATGGAFSQPIYIGQPNNSWDGSVIFDFTGLFVDQLGMMSVDSAGTWLSVYSGSTLLETVFGSGAVYDFVGIDTGGIGITRAIMSGNFYAVDDLRFNGTPISVPEPGSLLLFGAGLVGVAFARRRGIRNS